MDLTIFDGRCVGFDIIMQIIHVVRTAKKQILRKLANPKWFSICQNHVWASDNKQLSMMELLLVWDTYSDLLTSLAVVVGFFFYRSDKATNMPFYYLTDKGF